VKESDIQRAILDYLRACGIWCWRSYNGPTIHRQGVFSKEMNPGMPDIMGVLPGGTSLQIEVKKPKGVRSVDQISWIEKAQQHGAVAMFAESVQDVERQLHRILSAG
jgi:hypothetical protein